MIHGLSLTLLATVVCSDLYATSELAVITDVDDDDEYESTLALDAKLEGPALACRAADRNERDAAGGPLRANDFNGSMLAVSNVK